MKKPSFIIGKKQIILTCMTLMLGVAVYVNYSVTKSDIEVKKSVSASNDISVSQQKDSKDKKDNKNTTETGKSTQSDVDVDSINYGESEFVNGDATADYFAQARLEKMNNRDEAVQTLQTIMGGGDVTEDEMVTNALEAVEVSKLIESEGKIESLVKAQGIEDCVVYLDGESAKVVVKTQGLDTAQAATIKDIILGEVSVPAENIRVFEVK